MDRAPRRCEDDGMGAREDVKPERHDNATAIADRIFKLACAALLFIALTGAGQLFAPFGLPNGAYLQDVSFTPDGQELFATVVAVEKRTIVRSTRSGVWSPPRTVSFSGTWRDLEEVPSPDGKTIVFASNRPAEGGSRPIDAFFGGKFRPGRGGNLWEVTRQGDDWSVPVRLPNVVNSNNATFSPALAPGGLLYFMQASGPKATFHIFAAKLVNGAYDAVALAPFSDMRYSDFDATVTTDGSTVIFASSRPPSKQGTADLFVTFHRGNVWTRPMDIAASIDSDGDAIEPRFSPDAKTLYYTAGTPAELRSVDFTLP